MHGCVRAYVCAGVYVEVCAGLYTLVYVRTGVCACRNVRAGVRMQWCVCASVYVQVCEHVCVCVCVCAGVSVQPRGVLTVSSDTSS